MIQIKSKDIDSNTILTWADVFAYKDNKFDEHVKSITLRIDAGEVPTLEVEKYTGDSSETNISEYCVDKILIESKTPQLIPNKQETDNTNIAKLKEERIKNLNPICELEL